MSRLLDGRSPIYLQKKRLRLAVVNHDAVFDDYFLFAICETASAMAPMLAPEVRLQFAKRLKDMRTQRGFDRARYFAKSLGIEENRYTRYERAEVEPSLTLIHKMCETLRVSPNELLGFGEFQHERPFAAALGMAEASAGEGEWGHGANGADPSSSLAWDLAMEVVAVRHQQGGRSKAASDPMLALQETSALFRRLQADPFGTVAEIVEDRALREADAPHRAKLAELVQDYTKSVKEAADRRRR